MRNDKAFLEQITKTPADDNLRQVYADWLSDRDDPSSNAKADFLRAQASGHPVVKPVSEDTLDAEWLAKVDRTEIENCPSTVQFRFQCPKKWQELLPVTETVPEHDGPVSFCAACQQKVYYCATVDAAMVHAAENRCVAVSSTVERAPGDLRRPVRGMIAPSDLVVMGTVAPQLPRPQPQPPSPQPPERKWWQLWR